MTTTTDDPVGKGSGPNAPRPAGPRGLARDGEARDRRTSLRRVTRSELVKLRGLRAQWGLLLAAVLTTMVLGPVQSLGQVLGASRTGPLGGAEGAVALALSGVPTAAVIVGVLGAVIVTGEYPRRTIRITFTAVPRRGLVVAGKAAAFTLAGVACLFPAVLITFEVARQILARVEQAPGWTEPGVARAVIASAWLLIGWGLLGMALGWLTRSPLGASFALLGLMFVLPAIATLLPGGGTLSRWLPSEVGVAMLRTVQPEGETSPWAAVAVWTVYLVLGLALSTMRVNRSDA